MIELGGARVLIVGMAASGCEAAAAAAELGADTVLVDSSSSPPGLEESGRLRGMGVEVRLGVGVPGDIAAFDLLVTSPGVPGGAPVLRAALDAGLSVISELEFGYGLLRDERFVAVTGTNGKTTTTGLVAAILDGVGMPVVTGGNIGTPLTGLRSEAGRGKVMVVEVSSFQLAFIEEFRADVSIVLNLAPDHFDWHRDMEEYRAAKLRMIENMKPGDWLVYNARDPFCVEMSRIAAGGTVPFSSGERLERGLSVVEGRIVCSGDPVDAEIMRVDEIPLAGGHNLDDVMAASAAALLLGIGPPGARDAVMSFKGYPHRTEMVGEVDGVRFYNDSKATNPHASMSALNAFETPLVAIMGGRNKGLDFSELAAALCEGAFEGRIRGLVLLGESAGEIRSAVEGRCDLLRVTDAVDLDEAVRVSFEIAEAGDGVLFSPACASFDMFVDYKDRGRAFTEAVRRLEAVRDAGR